MDNLSDVCSCLRALDSSKATDRKVSCKFSCKAITKNKIIYIFMFILNSSYTDPVFNGQNVYLTCLL